MRQAHSRLERIQSQKKQTTRRIVLVGGFIILLISIALITRGLQFYNTIQAKTSHTKPTKRPEERHLFNFLLMGYGGGVHEGTYLTDTLMFLQIDTKKKKAILLSFPRDIWVKIPTKSGEDFHSKINSAYQMGLFPKEYPDVLVQPQDNASVIKKVVYDITGQTIDYYSTIDFDGFIKIIDLLGGIKVNVDTAFDDYEYPIDGKENDACGKKDKDLEDALNVATQDARLAFPCRYEHVHFDKGVVTMDGKTALKYARSRHSLVDGGDFNRAKRQQKVVEAIQEKVMSVGFVTKIIPLMNELEKNITTDLPLADLQKMLPEISKSKEYQLTKLVLTQENFLTSDRSDNGQYIIIPEAGMDNWIEVRREIKNIQLGITPTITPSITPKNLSPTTQKTKS